MPSDPHLMGVVWSHGMALGSPVVPEEKRILVVSSGAHAAASNRSVELKNLYHPTSPARRSVHPFRFSESTMAVGALARQTFSYIGRDFPARVIASCVNTALALPIRKRLSISSLGKLSGIEMTAAPALIIPR